MLNDVDVDSRKEEQKRKPSSSFFPLDPILAGLDSVKALYSIRSTRTFVQVNVGRLEMSCSFIFSIGYQFIHSGCVCEMVKGLDPWLRATASLVRVIVKFAVTNTIREESLRHRHIRRF